MGHGKYGAWNSIFRRISKVTLWFSINNHLLCSAWFGTSQKYKALNEDQTHYSVVFIKYHIRSHSLNVVQYDTSQKYETLSEDQTYFSGSVWKLLVLDRNT